MTLARLLRTAFASLLLLAAAAAAFGQGGLGGGISNPRPLTAQTVVGALGYSPARSGVNYDITALPGLTTPLSGAQGGTGVGNTGKTITLDGNLATSGAYGLVFVLSGPTSLALPTAGTVLTSTGNGSGLTGITAAQLSGLAPVATSGSAADLSTGNLSINRLGGGSGASGTTFWRGDGTWASPSGSGTVTSGTAGQVAEYNSSGDTVAGINSTGTGPVVRAASPALTGTPTAPTGAPGTGTTQIATQAYADAVTATSAKLDALLGSQTGSRAYRNGSGWVQQKGAFARVTGQGGATVAKSANITSVTRTAAGKFTVVMANAMPDANYRVLATCTFHATYGCQQIALDSSQGARSTTTFYVATYNYLGAYIDPDFLDIEVFE